MDGHTDDCKCIKCYGTLDVFKAETQANLNAQMGPTVIKALTVRTEEQKLNEHVRAGERWLRRAPAAEPDIRTHTRRTHTE